ncbi:MAG: polysaccharide biosynthesis tyrosine autokinase [Armatimonadetes bacterium]|nr:polysaccharide biosynthesis tyrosine autokinase [Armatimonadota bacterium]
MSFDVTGMPLGMMGDKGGAPGSESDLRAYMEILVRRRWWVLGSLMAGLVISFAYGLLAPPLYVISAGIEGPRAGQQMPPLSTTGVIPSLVGGLAGPQGDDMDLLQSWVLHERAVALLQHHPELWRECTLGKRVIRTYEDVPEEVRKTYDTAPPVNSPAPDELKMLRTMQVGQSTSGQVYNIRVVTGDLKKGCDLLNALCAAYLVYRMEDSRGWARSGLDQIREQLAKTEKKLADAEAALERFQQEHGVVSVSDQARQVVAMAGQLESQLGAARAALPSAEAALRHLTKTLEGQNPEVAAARVPMMNPLIEQLEEKLNKLYTQRLDLLMEYTEESQRVKALDAQIEAVKKQLQQAPREIMAPVTETQDDAYAGLVDDWLKSQAEVTALRAKIPALERALAKVKQQMMKMPQLGIEVARLRREVEIQQQTYLALRQQEDQLAVKYESAISRARILSPARLQPWQHPRQVRPRRLMGLALGIIGGLTIGFLLALGVEFFQDLYPSLAVAEAALGLPLLGALGMVKGGRSVLLEGPDAPEGLAEDILGVHTNVCFALPGAERRVVCVISPGRGEGKTTVACNLALAEVASGGTAVVVDCNVQNPRLHEVFSIPDVPGLSELLRDEATLDEVLHHPQGQQGPVVMPLGKPHSQALVGLQLRNKKLATAIDQLRARFGLVVLDGPEGTRFGDAQVIAVSSDGTVLVIAPGQTRRDQTRRCLMLLGQVGARVLGMVGNKVTEPGWREG